MIAGTYKTTVYFNKGDLVLIIKDWLTGSQAPLGLGGPSHPHAVSANIFLIDCNNVVGGFLEHDYYKTEPVVCRDIAYVLKGRKSEEIPGRIYSPETNSYRLVETEIIKQP